MGWVFLFRNTKCITFVGKRYNMKIIEILRSTSHPSIIARICLAVLIIFLYCCNSEKRVLNNPEKTQNIVNKYLETHPARTDTVNRFIPGDTITQLLVGYDTTVVHDTLNRRDTIKIRTTTEKIITRVDTFERKINNYDLLTECQQGLAKVDFDRKQALIDKQAASAEADKWRFRFWLVLIIFIVSLAIAVFKPKISF